MTLIARDPRRSETVEAHLRRSFAEAQRRVEDLRDEIEALAQCLMERRVLSRAYLDLWFDRSAGSAPLTDPGEKAYRKPRWVGPDPR